MELLSEEQSTILHAAKLAYESPLSSIIQISARSGSGKTFMLAAITKELVPKSGMYLAYNKSIAEESKTKFPSTVACRTTHSLAYGNIVKNLGLEVGFFGYKNIHERIPFEEKLIVVDIIERFCLSDSTDIHQSSTNFPTKLVDIAKLYIRKMQSKQISCTHSFYLKLYQLSLKAGVIKPKPVDLLMLDEAGDINEVTLSIFQLLPAKLKILVGDNHQNIYSFNGTINGFEALKGVGQYFELTKSFRVSSSIAVGIERFCQTHLDPKVKFVGVNYKHSEISEDSHAFISRTNASMIGRMIELDDLHMQYNLVRKVKDIFELIMILVYLRPGGDVFNIKYKFLQNEADDWNSHPENKLINPTLFSYISDVNEGDIEIASAMSLLSRFGKDTIIDTYSNALRHEEDKRKHKITLCTAHS
jgi:F-box protein, helicase, 18